MESFVITGKAETVFRLLQLRARVEREKRTQPEKQPRPTATSDKLLRQTDAEPGS